MPAITHAIAAAKIPRVNAKTDFLFIIYLTFSGAGYCTPKVSTLIVAIV